MVYIVWLKWLGKVPVSPIQTENINPSRVVNDDFSPCVPKHALKLKIFLNLPGSG